MTDPSQAEPDSAPATPPAEPPAAPSSAAPPVFGASPATAAGMSIPKPPPTATVSTSQRPDRAPPRASAAPAQPYAGRSALPVLTAIGFIFVLLAIAWVWTGQRDFGERLAALSVPPPSPPPPSVEPARVAALEARLKGFEQRLGALENRPLPEPPSAPVPAAAPDPAAAAAAAALAAQVGALEQRLKDDEQRQGALAARAALAGRLQQAATALDAGEPLGDLPAAPPALARFAETRPPTEAALRLAFPAAAAAAEQASRPSADGKSLGERILMHASSLVTVRQGSRVVVGAPAATVLGAAAAQLEAGDLAGALATLDGLDSAAAQAMAGWRGDARALLDARAALAQMARG